MAKYPFFINLIYLITRNVLDVDFIKNPVFVLVVIFTSSCSGQKSISGSIPDAKAGKWFEEARAESRRGNTEKAHQLYEKVIKSYPGYTIAYLMKGGLYFEKEQWDKAREMFLDAIKTDPDVDKEVFYSLALVAEKQKDFRSAVQWFEKYLLKAKEEEPKYYEAIGKIKINRFRAVAIENPVPFAPKPLPYPVNTHHSEYTPQFTADGSQMIFVRRENFVENLYITDWDGQQFSEPRLMEEISTRDNEGVHTLSADGNFLIFTACNRKVNFGSCDLWYTYKNANGSWAIPVNMGNHVNSAAWDGQPSLSADGQILYFSSNRQGGKGGKDIWWTKRGENGRWIDPQNAGDNINTPGHEETPFLHADSRTLYFRSTGHPGMGGFDLFFAHWDDTSHSWGVPKNLGYPINTENDEGGLTISLDGATAYFASDRNGPQVDIFQFEMYEAIRPQRVTYLKIMVADASTQKPLSTRFTLINENSGEVVVKETDLSGSALHVLPFGNTYNIFIEKEGYMYFSERINLELATSEIDPYIYYVKLVPSERTEQILNQPFILNNIRFEVDSDVLVESSYFEIEKIYSLLGSQKNWNVMITGHTDNTGSPEYNLSLSYSRAKAVMDALIEKGIDFGRIQIDGKGESEPIASNDTADGRRLNRRTEMIIFIKE
ncbi:MAG TPA: OmpA family protein [Saprospiraceae bacterium]|nr:OmpA family protein [Saprospiraceae bacterium]